LLAVLGFLAYAVAVGGDFMAMGRFLIPSVPLVAVIFAEVVAALAPAGRAALALACAALSLLPAFNLHAAPRALREKLHFRWGNRFYLTEYESWERMKGHAEEWSAIGRALALHTSPGEAMTAQGIGCFGYFTELTIIDLLGLVNRELLTMRVRMSGDSAGHRVRPSAEYMRYLTDTLKPAYGGAEIAPSRAELRPLSEQAAEQFEELLFDLDPSKGFAPGSVLRILKVRY
jgi:hypothetical protein